MADSALVRLDRRDGYAVVTLDRPEKRNALSFALQQQILAALDEVRDSAKAVVIRANGPAFCAGVDLAEAKERAAQKLPGLGQVWFETLQAIRRHPAVLIAAVNGFALGGGLTLVNLCEMAVASSAASFGMPEVGFGEFPGLAGATTLHRIAPKHAARMILTAQRFDAQQALRWGLVNEVVAAEELVPTAEVFAAQIAKHDATVLRVTKRALRELPGQDWNEAIARGMWFSALSRGEAP